MPRTVEPVITIERLTPEDARSMLAANENAIATLGEDYFRNRRPSKVEVLERRNQIHRHLFDPWAHMGIRLDRHGVVLNGNHTLHALAGADEGSEIDCIVIRNVPRASANSMDTGRRRTNAQVLEMAGVDDPKAKATAARIIHALTTPDFPHKKLGTVRLTNLETERLYFDNKDMEDYLELAKQLQVEVGINAGLAMGILHLANKDRPDWNVTVEFVEGVCNPVNLSASDPRTKLAQRYALTRGKRGGGGAKQREDIISFVKCWNAYIQGSPIQRLTISADRGPDELLQAADIV